MITRFLFFITFMSIIFSTDTIKVSKNKYISIPIDFDRGSYDFNYGINNDWEINLGFSILPEFANTDKDLYADTDSYLYYTYTDEQWEQTVDTVSFNRYVVRNNRAYTDYTVSIGFKKFFKYKENLNNSSTFYVQTNIAYNNYGGGRSKAGSTTYTTEEYLDIGYEYIEEPTDPEEGDIFGEFYDSDVTKTMVSSSSYKSSHNSTIFELALGCQYNTQQEIFGISDLYFGMNIEFLSLLYSKHESYSFRSYDYNEDLSSREDYSSEDFDESDDIIINGPSINLFLKYFFN